MKLFVICSKHFYHKLPETIAFLEQQGHQITPPNCYDDPFKEEEMKLVSKEAHSQWKGAMIRLQKEKVDMNDGVLVMNYEKNGQANYIGGATFLEIFRAWDSGKKIFLFNPIPDNIFKDELHGMNPTIIHQNFSKIQ